MSALKIFLNPDSRREDLFSETSSSADFNASTRSVCRLEAAMAALATDPILAVEIISSTLSSLLLLLLLLLLSANVVKESAMV